MGNKIKGKFGQEEIVGFALIVIIVTIILVFFLIFSLSDKTEVESYETSSFLQASLQYTSDCVVNNFENLSVQKLIVACYYGEQCGNGRKACLILNSTLKGMLNQVWQVGSKFPEKGYKLEIVSGEEKILSIQKGNITGSYKGTQQMLPEGRVSINVLFRTYY